MPIVKSELTELYPHKTGFRARYAFTFTDGRVIARGPSNVKDKAEALSLMPTLEPRVLKSAQRADAGEAVSLGIKGKYKEATSEQVDQAYLDEAEQ